MIAEGKYRARALEADFGNSNVKGTPFIRVLFEAQTHDGPALVSWDGYFTERTQERTLESLRHCGCTFPGDDVTRLEGLSANEVEIVVEHESFERDGRVSTRARIAWVNAIGQGGKVRDEDKMDQNAKAAFAKSMRGHLVASRGGKAAPSSAAPRRNGPAKQKPIEQPAAAADDDSLPF